MTTVSSLLSVVVPLYNKSQLVSRCIKSITSQSVLPKIIIIVNDGSTDDSVESAISSLVDYSGNYKIVTQENNGVSVARNTGINLCDTEFVCLLDADDEWDRFFIERMLSLINDFPSADLYCLGHRVFDPKVGIFKPAHGFDEGFRGYLNDYFAAAKKGSVANSSKIALRKSSLLDVGGFPAGAYVGEDLYVWMMLAINGKVACDSFSGAIINQVEDDSRKKRHGAMPYPFTFFSQKKNLQRLSKTAKNYLAKVLFLHLIESSMAGDFIGGLARFKAGFSVVPVHALIYLPVLLIPSFLLKKLKLLRRKTKKIMASE